LSSSVCKSLDQADQQSCSEATSPSTAQAGLEEKLREGNEGGLPEQPQLLPELKRQRASPISGSRGAMFPPPRLARPPIDQPKQKVFSSITSGGSPLSQIYQAQTSSRILPRCSGPAQYGAMMGEPRPPVRDKANCG